MRALFIIDAESFSPVLKNKVAAFRRQLPPTVPVFWTVTGHEEPKPTLEDGFQAGRDRLFIKRDIDSSLETSIDENGVYLLDYLRTTGITEGYVTGATHYGCVMGAGLSLREINIAPVIIQDVTDFNELTPEDHREAEQDWKNAAVPTITSTQALSLLRQGTGPKPSP